MAKLAKAILRDEKVIIKTPYFHREFVIAIQSIPRGYKTWNPKHEYWTVFRPYRKKALSALEDAFEFYTIVDKRGEPDKEFEESFNRDQKARAKRKSDERRERYQNSRDSRRGYRRRRYREDYERGSWYERQEEQFYGKSTVERRSGISFSRACKVLGVDKDTTYQLMKKAYWALAKKLHSDKQGGEDEKMKELNNAWDVIKAYKI